METLRSLTSDTGRIAYRLRSMPADFAPLSAACPGVRLSAEGGALVAEFDSGLSVADVNAALLPRLLDLGVEAVTPGRTLAETYLRQTHPTHV